MRRKRLPNRRWTEQTIKEAASKYNFLQDFRIENPGAYATASALKILPKVTSHMDRSGKWAVRKEWSNEGAKIEALKYKTVKDFKSGSASAYRFCIRAGIYFEATIHMKRQPGKKIVKIIP